MRALQSKRIWLLLLLVGILFVFMWANHAIKVRKMTQKIDSLPMRTVCLGRFVMDVPADAIVTYGRAAVTGWDFETLDDESDELFAARLKSKEVELITERNERNGQSLESVREIKTASVHGKIFVYGRQWVKMGTGKPPRTDEIVSIDAYVHMNGVSYKLRGKIHREDDVKELESILARWIPLNEGEIPTHAGFCFDRAMLSGELGAQHHEFAVMFVGLQNHPDLSIALSSIAGTKPGKTFLQREAENSTKIENPSRFRTLRQGSRSLNEIPGEEVLDHVSELNGSELQGFMWESLTKEGDIYLPSLSLEFDTGYGKPGSPVNSSFSDSEALALWDKISSSLRHRPTKENPTSSQSASATP